MFKTKYLKLKTKYLKFKVKYLNYFKNLFTLYFHLLVKWVVLSTLLALHFLVSINTFT